MSVEWDVADWQAFFDECAGIMEYDERLPREQAEMIARAEVIKLKRRHRAEAESRK